MTKLERISELHDRKIIWRETGDIVHFDLKGKLLHREKYSKKSLSRILDFFDRKPEANPKLIAQFNVAAHEVISHITAIDLIEVNEHGVEAVIGNERKIRAHNSGSGNIVQLAIHKNDGFKPDMRYSIILKNNKITFKILEPIMPENFNTTYSDPILSIYVSNA